jgi:hypothetical protein
MNLKFSKKHLAIFSIVFLVFVLFLFFYKPTATHNEGFINWGAMGNAIRNAFAPGSAPAPSPVFAPIPKPAIAIPRIGNSIHSGIGRGFRPIVKKVNNATDVFRQLAKGLKGSGRDKVTITVPADPGNPAAGIPGAPAKTITYVFTEDELYALAKKYGNNADALTSQYGNHVNGYTVPPSFIPPT